MLACPTAFISKLAIAHPTTYISKYITAPAPTSTLGSQSKPPDFPPQEILSRIFSYLPLTDRKNCRLVSSSWYEASTDTQLLKTEKFVCISEYRRNSEQTFKLLFKCRRPLLNVEFHGFKINRKSKGFWKKCGPKIDSLSFMECSFNKWAARNLIGCCNQMTQLSVNKCSGIFTSDVLDGCLKKEITVHSLRELNIIFDGDINDYVFNRLCEVYPCITKITVSLVNDRRYNTTCRDVYFEEDAKSDQPNYDSKKIFSHSAVFSKLKSQLLEELTYTEIDKDTCRMHSNLVNALHHAPNIKLKRFHFSPSVFNTVTEPAFRMFFSEQNTLEDVTLAGVSFSSQSFGHLLDSCPMLRSLELEDLRNSETLVNSALEPLMLGYDVFEKLASSGLRTLKLHFDLWFDESEYLRDSISNSTLRDLSIVSPSLLKRDVLLFVETFCNLSRLNLSSKNVDDALLQVILKDQVNLVSLILSFNTNITDYGFVGKLSTSYCNIISTSTFSIRRLKELENLDLTGCEHITGVSISEMVLPNLKFLSLRSCNAIPDESFLSLMENCPALEFLDVSHTSVSPANLIKLSQDLKKLYFLDFTFCRNDQENLMTSLQSSKSLRFINHTFDRFYYNLFENKWKPMNSKIWLAIDDTIIRKYYHSTPRRTSGKLNCFRRNRTRMNLLLD